MTTREAGILPDSMIRELIDKEAIATEEPINPGQIQPASLDLRLGGNAWRIHASFLPGREHTVTDKLLNLDKRVVHEVNLTKGAILETGCVYLVPLMERLALKKELSASANPKSSTGRLDVFTRVITDHAQAFDQVKAGYKGPLYLEISPRTFPIVVRKGSRLSQIRFRSGTGLARLSKEKYREIQRKDGLVIAEKPDINHDGIGLSVNLSKGLVGYRSKRHTDVIDIDREGLYEIVDFWEPVHLSGLGRLILDPNEFYILASQEAVRVPPICAAEMMPYNPIVGEFRVHYAGFFDPGFGCVEANGKGARAVLEVRSHQVPFIIEHNQLVGRLVYQYMCKPPDNLYGAKDSGSNYQGQGLRLSKHFRQD